MFETDRPLDAAFDRLSQIRETELGQTLLERPRYGHFRPLDMPIEQWMDLFDNDINNFEHNGLTAYLADMVAVCDGVSDETRASVVLTASIHDLPEDVTGSKTGDKQYNLSNAEDEKVEHARLRELALDHEFPLTPEQIETSIAIMADSKLKPPQTQEGFLFNIVERIGYLRTAFIAWDLVQEGKIFASHVPNVTWMVGNIIGNHLEYLLSVRHLSPSIELQLTSNWAKIGRIMKTLETPRTKAEIWQICSVTGDGNNKLNPDMQIESIEAAFSAFAKAN